MCEQSMMLVSLLAVCLFFYLFEGLLYLLVEGGEVLRGHGLHEFLVEGVLLLAEPLDGALEVGDLVDGVEGALVVVVELLLPELVVIVIELYLLWVLLVLIVIKQVARGVLVVQPLVRVLAHQFEGHAEEVGHLCKDLLRLFGEEEERVESEDDSRAFVLVLVLGLVERDFPEEGGEHVVLVRAGEGLEGRGPEEEGEQLRVEHLEHAGGELEGVELGEVPDVAVDAVGEGALVVLEQVGHEGGAAGDVQLAGVLVGPALVDLAEEVEEQADEVVAEGLEVGLAAQAGGLLDVVAQHRHRLLHHLEVVARADVLQQAALLLGQRQRVQRGPHLLGDAHQVVHHHLEVEPHRPRHLPQLEQVGVQQHQHVLHVVAALLPEHELRDAQHRRLQLRDHLAGDGRLDDARDGLEAAGRGQLRLPVVLLLVGLLDVLVEELEVELGEVEHQVVREGGDLQREVLDDALEGVDDVFQVVALEQVQVDRQDVLEEGTHEVLGGGVLEDAVEGGGCLDADEGVFVLGEAEVDALHRGLHDVHLQLHRAVLREDVHRARPQEHDGVFELGDDVLGDEGGQQLLDLLGLGDGRAQLADEVHRQLLLDLVAALQLRLQVVHVLVEEHARLVGLPLLLRLVAQLREAHPHVRRHPLEVGEVDRGLVLAREELDGLAVGELLVLGLEAHELVEEVVLEGLGVLPDGLGALGDEHLEALELEVAHLLGGADVELRDECLDEVVAVVGVPALGEGAVVLVAVEGDPLGVLLDEAQEHPRRPFLGVEVVELGRLALLQVLGVAVELRVGGPHHHVQQRHPRAGQALDLGADLVVDRLPEELDAEVDELVLLVLADQLQEGWQGGLEELEEVVALLLGDAELEAGGDGQQDVQERHQVLPLGDALDDGHHGQPVAVLEAHDDGEDLLVDLDELVVAVAADDRQQQRVLDGLLLLAVHLLPLCVPVQLHVVLQLDQRRLLHLHRQRPLVHDLHQRHRKTHLLPRLPQEGSRVLERLGVPDEGVAQRSHQRLL